jgi:hypothetical protein
VTVVANLVFRASPRGEMWGILEGKMIKAVAALMTAIVGIHYYRFWLCYHPFKTEQEAGIVLGCAILLLVWAVAIYDGRHNTRHR